MARAQNERQTPKYSDPGPLGGARIALSSAPEIQPLAALLERGGAAVHRFQPGTTSVEHRLERWLAALVDDRFDDVVFFSAQGVRLVCELAGQLGRGQQVQEALRRTRLVAQGARTAGALAEFGLTAAARSKKPGPGPLLEVLTTLGLTGRVVAFEPREGGGDPELQRGVERAGATVHLDEQPPVTDASARNTLDRILTFDFDSLVLFDTSEVTWLWDAALSRGRTGALRESLSRMSVVASEAAAEALKDLGVRARALPPSSFQVDSGSGDIGSLFRGSPGGRDRRRSETAQLLIVGGGIAAHELCDQLANLDVRRKYQVTLLCEEPVPPYDRTRLSSCFATRETGALTYLDALAYERRAMRLRLGTRATHLDCDRQVVFTAAGESLPYDVLVLATGAAPHLPSIQGIDKLGVIAYRSAADLEKIVAYAGGRASVAVIGGGLLGIEAAGALSALGLSTHVIEIASRLMPRQLDLVASDLLRQRLAERRITTHVGKTVARIAGDERATGLRFSDGSRLEVDMVLVCAGVRPRDELARTAGLDVSDDGGVVVSDSLETSDPRVYAIGDCARHRGTAYGLASPARQMARALARGFADLEGRTFTRPDTSTRLGWSGIEVASVGDALSELQSGRSIVFSDLARGVYKKLALSADGARLLGAVLVGDTTQFDVLVAASAQSGPLSSTPEELLIRPREPVRREHDSVGPNVVTN